ncbi:MAG: hypothetical protein JSU98_09365 [Gemmatimonadales bacterium]|jgi:hypothetical protein|nr:MAG: hypothetical protein JSU98_09365 [Gemmatimonadales bacterium]
MQLFEFLMVLISVVIGLGLTEILSGVANLLRARQTVRVHWIHALFVFGIFFALLQQWWESWDMVGLESIGFPVVLALLAPSVILFLIAHLIFPARTHDVDLEAYYYQQAPLLWGLVILGTLEGTFVLPLMVGDRILEPANISGIPLVILSAALVVSKSPRVHSVVAPLILVMVVLDTILANPAISTL